MDFVRFMMQARMADYAEQPNTNSYNFKKEYSDETEAIIEEH